MAWGENKPQERGAPVRFEDRGADEAPMFLVRVPTGRKARVYRVIPREVTSGYSAERRVFIRRYTPRAWWMRISVGSQSRVTGAAAVANTIEEAHGLIARLKASQPNE